MAVGHNRLKSCSSVWVPLDWIRARVRARLKARAIARAKVMARLRGLGLGLDLGSGLDFRLALGFSLCLSSSLFGVQLRLGLFGLWLRWRVRVEGSG